MPSVEKKLEDFDVEVQKLKNVIEEKTALNIALANELTELKLTAKYASVSVVLQVTSIVRTVSLIFPTDLQCLLISLTVNFPTFGERMTS